MKFAVERGKLARIHSSNVRPEWKVCRLNSTNRQRLEQTKLLRYLAGIVPLICLWHGDVNTSRALSEFKYDNRSFRTRKTPRCLILKMFNITSFALPACAHLKASSRIITHRVAAGNAIRTALQVNHTEMINVAPNQGAPVLRHYLVFIRGFFEKEQRTTLVYVTCEA